MRVHFGCVQRLALAVVIVSGTPAARLAADVATYVRIARVEPTSNPASAASFDPAEFRVVKQTHGELLRLRPTIAAALERRGITGLVLLKDVTDPATWLAQKLSVTSHTDSELVEVRLADDGTEAEMLLNAVVTTYVERANGRGRSALNDRLDKLRATAEKAKHDWSEKSRSYQELSKTLGALDKESAQIRSKLLFDQLVGQQRLGADAAVNLRKLQAQRTDTERMIALEESNRLSDEDIDNALRQNAELGPKYNLRDQLRMQRDQHRGPSGVPKDSTHLKNINAQLKQAEVDLASAIDQMRSEVEQRFKNSSMGPLQFNLESVHASIASYEQMAQSSAAESEKLRADLVRLTDRSADLAALRKECDRAERVVDELFTQLQQLEQELDVPDRLTIEQEAAPWIGPDTD